MDTFSLKKTGFFLFAIAALALLVRLPGLFWGFNSFTIPSFTVYHEDELHLASIAQKIMGQVDKVKLEEKLPKYVGIQKSIYAGLALFRQYAAQEKAPRPVVRGLDWALFIAKNIDSGEIAAKKANYPRGYPYQVVGLASLLHFKTATPLMVIGRALSIFYAVLTVVLIYFFSLELFSSSLIALLASVFLALAGLHVTQSHIAIVDSGNTFWIYATSYFSLLSLRRKKTVFFILALLSGGIALTFKFAIFMLIPLFYILRRQKRRGLSRLLLMLSLIFFFLMAVGSFDSLYNFIFILHNIFKNNLVNHGPHNRLLNPFIYALQLFAGIGLPVFLLFLYGGWQLFRQRRLFGNIFNRDVFVVLFLPLLLHLVGICLIRHYHCRHTLPLVPLLTVVAAFGFMELTKIKIIGNSRLKASFLFLFVLIYQFIYVCSTEYYYVYDTREEAAKWVLENVRPGTALTYEGKPALYEYSVNADYNTPYIIVSSSKFPYGVSSSIINPFKEYPEVKNVGFGTAEQSEIVKDLFSGTYNYSLVKKFEVKSITPELFLYKKLMGVYPTAITDTVIFKSNEIASKNT